MTLHQEVPELLEQYMDSMGTEECWVTVKELRLFFNLDIPAGQAFAGFLQKIYQGPYYSCRYKVVRMEKYQETGPPYRVIRKYLVQLRPSPREKPRPSRTGSQTRMPGGTR